MSRTEPNMFLEWQEYILKQYATFIHNEPINTNHTHHNIPILKSQLKEIHKTITITATDKMKNNYRFTCSEYYKQILYQKITCKKVMLTNQNILTPTIENKTAKAYIQLKQTPKEILEQQTKELTKWFMPMGPHNIPYIYPIFKCHKNNSRGVTAAYNVLTSPISKILHTALKLMLNTQQQHNNTRYLLKGINTTWRIDNSTDLINKLHNLNKNTKHTPNTVQTYDIEGFYDNIDISEMEKIIKTFVPKMFKITNKKYIIIKNKNRSAYWSHKIDDFNITLTEESIIALQTWQLNNATIMYNNKIYKQIKGIAQGTNQSPDLADIILNHYEEQFIKHHHKNNNHQILSAFENTYRKMDDILCINNPITNKWIYQDETNPHGIYPKKYFTLTTEENQPQPTTNYLDTTIFITQTPPHLLKESKYINTPLHELRQIAKKYKLIQHGNKSDLIQRIESHTNTHNTEQLTKTKIWDTKTYNKTDKFPIQSINFPHITSNTHRNIKSGSILGRLHAFTITNMYNYKNYTDNVGKLFTKLILKNQYDQTKLINLLDRYLSKDKNKNLYNQPKQNLL